MTSELTKAAQQALREVHMLILPVPAPEMSTLDLAKAVSERATKIAMLLTAALTQRPAAQTEREADGLPLIVAGAIFDFAGFMTTRSEVIEVGSTAEAGPVADLVKEWAELRGLDLADAAVLSWQLHIIRASLPAPQQATPEPLIVKGAMAGMVDAQVRDLWPTKGATLAPQQATPATPEDMNVYGGIAAGYFADTQQATPEPVGEPTEGEFFAFDPDGGNAFYKTRQEAIDHAKESLKYYLEGANAHGEWDEDVEQIRWGVVMQRAKATNISVTEDGENSCDYELQHVATRPAPGVPDGLPAVLTDWGFDVHDDEEGRTWLTIRNDQDDVARLSVPTFWPASGRQTINAVVLHQFSAALTSALAAAQAKGGDK